jgi:DNA/RNA endonuclease G (NUC1)
MRLPARSAFSAALLMLGLLLSPVPLQAEEGLASCASAFVNDDVDAAPKRIQSTASTMADTTHLCYRLGDKVFFALEYSSRRLTANWVAHRLEDTFGERGCGSIPWDDMNCYFKGDDLAACLALPDEEKPKDPFHEDGTLKARQKPRLGTEAFRGTKHDRGHLAPNQAHSGHVCGAGQTFTMANMAPQLDELNRRLWADLEEQVLFWAVTEGPIYVVTGTTFTPFPTEKFQGHHVRWRRQERTRSNEREAQTGRQRRRREDREAHGLLQDHLPARA